MAAEACTTKCCNWGNGNVLKRFRPLALGRNGRVGALPGLQRSSRTKADTSARPEEPANASHSHADQSIALYGGLRATTVVPALSFLQGHQVLNVLHAVITVYPWPFYFLMAFAPRSDLTKRLLMGAKSLVPLAVLYGILLVASWTPETLSTLLPGDFAEGINSALQGKPKMMFLPEIESIGKLLSAPIASVSAWAHLQFIAFFCARWIWLDGLMNGVNTVHSVLLCAVLPPLGFLAHIFTTFLKRKLGSHPNSRSANAPSTPASAPATASPVPAANPPAPPSPPAQPASSSWGPPSAAAGVASSHPSTAGDGNAAALPAASANGNGNGAAPAAPTAPLAAPPAPSANEAAPKPEVAPASIGLFGRPKKDAGRNGDSSNGTGSAAYERHTDESWTLTVLEPVYVQRS